MVSGEVERQHALFRKEDEARLQIRAALENIGGELADADFGVNVRLPKARLHLEHGRERVRLAPSDALAEASRGFKFAGH